MKLIKWNNYRYKIISPTRVYFFVDTNSLEKKIIEVLQTNCKWYHLNSSKQSKPCKKCWRLLLHNSSWYKSYQSFWTTQFLRTKTVHNEIYTTVTTIKWLMNGKTVARTLALRQVEAVAFTPWWLIHTTKCDFSHFSYLKWWCSAFVFVFAVAVFVVTLHILRINLRYI